MYGYSIYLKVHLGCSRTALLQVLITVMEPKNSPFDTTYTFVAQPAINPAVFS